MVAVGPATKSLDNERGRDSEVGNTGRAVGHSTCAALYPTRVSSTMLSSLHRIIPSDSLLEGPRCVSWLMGEYLELDSRSGCYFH